MADSPKPVGLVFVSHSSKIAEGLVELARQMAPETRLVPAGGTDDGGIGTSFTKVAHAIAAADAGAGVAVLCDLGSAILTAETALEFLDDVMQERVQIVDAPLIEGGVAAAVAAETGGDLAAVVAAAQSAGSAAPPGEPPVDESSHDVTRIVSLVNEDGLHARPAAEFARLASTLDARVTVNGADARSLLAIMSLGLTKGMTARISSSGDGAEAAVHALAELIESGFGEGPSGVS